MQLKQLSFLTSHVLNVSLTEHTLGTEWWLWGGQVGMLWLCNRQNTENQPSVFAHFALTDSYGVFSLSNILKSDFFFLHDFFFVLLLAVVYKTIFSITFLFKLYNLKTFRSVAAIFYYWEVKLEQVKLFSARFWHHLWSIGLAGQSLSVETWVSCMYAAMFGNQGTVSHSVRFSHILKWNL